MALVDTNGIVLRCYKCKSWELQLGPLNQDGTHVVVCPCGVPGYIRGEFKVQEGEPAARQAGRFTRPRVERW